MRIIGDVHGEYSKYIPLALGSPDGLSVCVGDVGFNYDMLNAHLDPSKHICIPGNHDNHRAYSPHFVGRFGEHTLGSTKFFYIGGAYSIDVKLRTYDIDWWPEEELNAIEMNDCWDLWEKSDCDIMITHDAPTFLVRSCLSNYWPDWAKRDGYRPSKTNNFLDEIFKHKQPKLWLFGHNHQNRVSLVGNTTFLCINILQYVDL